MMLSKKKKTYCLFGVAVKFVLPLMLLVNNFLYQLEKDWQSHALYNDQANPSDKKLLAHSITPVEKQVCYNNVKQVYATRDGRSNGFDPRDDGRAGLFKK